MCGHVLWTIQSLKITLNSTIKARKVRVLDFEIQFLIYKKKNNYDVYDCVATLYKKYSPVKKFLQIKKYFPF